jgi:hypothetical protein
MTAPTIQFKRGSYVNLPGLQAGEPALTTDTYELYVGIDSTTNNNKFFGSHRYWKRETTSTGSGVNLVEGTTNGSSYITLKSPDSLAGVTTYTFPATPTADYYLKTSADGTLSWAQVSQSSFGGIVSFTDTTDSYNKDTGSVVIEGGLGVEKSANIGGNFSVAGVSTFVGSVTFQGGTINLGDSNTDDINVAGEFVSNLIPNASGEYEIGTADKRWKSLNVSGFVTSTALRVTGDARVGSLTVDSNLNVLGNVTVGGTTVSLIAQTLNIRDSDIILGVRTDAQGNDVATDTTANHGGIAIASTEGYPLVNLTIAGIETVPPTYKKFMWFKAGSFTGLGTDAWLSNYAIGIGSTQFPTGTRLAVGSIQLTETDLTVPGKVTVGGGMTVTNGDVYINDALYVGGFQVTGGVITGEDVRSRNLNVSGITTLGDAVTDLVTVAGNTTFNASVSAVNINASGIVTATSFDGSLALADITGLGVGVSAFLATPSSANLASAVTDETGSGALVFANTPTLVTPVLGAASATSIEVSGSVNVGTALSAPTIKTATVQHSNGTQAATIDTSGNITASQNLTVSGNLYVNGSTTQVNTASMTVEDRTIELGQVDGATPSAPTTWDLGVLFNYNSSGAKKSGFIWEHADGRFKFGSQVTDGGGTDNDSPQITVSNYAGIEVGSIWVNDCAGQSQLVSCAGGVRSLQNISIDGGTF